MYQYGVYVCTPGRPHWHANSYNVCNADDVGLPNSIARDERAAEMKIPETLQDMIDVLGDTLGMIMMIDEQKT